MCFYVSWRENAPLSAVVAMTVLVSVILWGLGNPAVGRRLASITAVPPLALGTGLVAWAIFGLITGRTELLQDRDAPELFRSVPGVFGMGIAFLVGGFTALGLAFAGSGRNRAPSEPGAEPQAPVASVGKTAGDDDRRLVKDVLPVEREIRIRE
jgi:hypothetical protein